MRQQPQPAPIQVLSYLRQVQFPTDKAELIRAAKRQNAPEQVIKTIANLPGQLFNQASDITSTMHRTR